jgi:hypothetical protein
VKALVPVAVSGTTDTTRTGNVAALPVPEVGTITDKPELPVVVEPVP